MRHKKITISVATLALAGCGLLAAPAFAAGGCTSNCSASTNVTFALSGAGLSISVPSNADVDLGTATTNVVGTSVTGSLHPTTVTDTRGQVLAPWTVTVSSSGFTGSGAAAGHSLAAGNATMYLDTVSTLANVVALATGGLLPTSAALQATPVTLSSGGATLLAGTTTGSGTITYTPDISVSIPAATVAGTYSGAVTQTVS
ncbi:MAG: hypothetical protein ACJ735_01960 [Actinomycetes bacterium]